MAKSWIMIGVHELGLDAVAHGYARPYLYRIVRETVYEKTGSVS
jgi:hypothetical protein